MNNVGIVVIAVSVKDEVKSRFLEFLEKSNPSHSVITCLVTEQDGSFTTNNIFNKSKALNFGISKIATECEVLIQTDIDMIIPPHLIDITYDLCIAKKCHVFARCRNSDKLLDDWEFYKNIDLREAGYGAWNAMSTAHWYSVGGFNEDMYGWGREDDELHTRIKWNNIETVILTEYPLVHINHSKRIENRALENEKIKTANDINWLTHKNNTSKRLRKTVLCTAGTAMGLGDGVMLMSTILDLSKKYNVRAIVTPQANTIIKKIDNGNTIKVYDMNSQGHFYSNDHERAYNLIYWDVYNGLRQLPHQAINMIRKCADLPLINLGDKYILPEIPIPHDIEIKSKQFIESLKPPVIITQPFMSYWNKMFDANKYHKLLDELMKIGTVVQIGGQVPDNIIHQRSINLVGNTSLEQSLAMIKYADVVFSGDSFMQHASASLRTPTVTYFCGTHPFDFGYPFHANICHDDVVTCQRKCGRPQRWLYDYNYKDPNHWNTRDEAGWICPHKLCERAITIDEVIEAIQTQLVIGRDRDWSFYTPIYSSWKNDPSFKV